MALNLDRQYATAPWLADPSRIGPQEEPSAGALTHVKDRSPEQGTGHNITSVRVGTEQLPFVIGLRGKDQQTIFLRDSQGVSFHSLELLVNPSDVNFGSTQVMSSQFARDAFVNSLWGAAQGTLVGNGTSGGFFLKGLSGNVGGGLAGAEPRSQRRETLAYANLLSFITLMRNNGYIHHVLSSPATAVTPSSTSQGEGLASESYQPKQGADSTETISSGNEQITAPVSPVASLLGYRRTRVIDSLNLVSISYDGTTYLGNFLTFSLDANPETPFLFRYSFEFVISGLLGDTMEGHLAGTEPTVGIQVGLQGTSFLSSSIAVSNQLVNKANIVTYVEQDRKVDDTVAGAELANELLKSPFVQFRSNVNLQGLSKERIINKFELLYQAFKPSADLEKAKGNNVSQWFPPVITSAVDGTHSATSLHYEGLAVDVRSKTIFGVPESAKLIILARLKSLFGNDYDIILESVGKEQEHFHIEYDPKPKGRLGA